MFCENCGAQLEEDAVFCENCGARVETGESAAAFVPEETIQTVQGAAPDTPPPLAQNPPVKSGPRVGLIIGIAGGIVAVILVVLIVLLAGPSLKSSVAGIFTREKELEDVIEITDAGIAFGCPDGWEMEAAVPEEGSLITLSDKKGNRITILEADRVSMLDSFTEQEIRASYASAGVGELTEVLRTSVSGIPAVKCVLPILYQGKSAVQEQYFYNSGSHLYAVVLTAVQDYKKCAPVFDRVMDSFVVTPPVNGETSYETWEESYETGDGEVEYGDYGTAYGEEDLEGVSDADPMESLRYCLISEPIKITDTDFNNYLTLYPDWSFTLKVNLYEGFGDVSGNYQYCGDSYDFIVTYIGFVGFIGDDLDMFKMEIRDDRLVYTSSESLGSMTYGMEFFVTDTAFQGEIGLQGQENDRFDFSAYIGKFECYQQNEDETVSVVGFIETYDAGNGAIEGYMEWPEGDAFKFYIDPEWVSDNSVVLYLDDGAPHKMTFVVGERSPYGWPTIYIDGNMDRPYVFFDY